MSSNGAFGVPSRSKPSESRVIASSTASPSAAGRPASVPAPGPPSSAAPTPVAVISDRTASASGARVPWSP